MTPASDAVADAYNEVAFTSDPNAACHPDRLATIATLLGLDAAPVATSRVLELACGDGMNLLAIAATLPHAAFVGIDFAARPLARAQRMADNLGLGNVSLLQLDLREVPATLGQFDCIIAHGLYSWIPVDVRAHLLPLIARHLAPKGVAFVSFNVLPGCHLRRAVWDMLHYHTRNIPDLKSKVAAARALTRLVGTPGADEDIRQQAFRAEVRHVGESSESELAHDDLSIPNNPVYFHEFAADAAHAGLAFLAESKLYRMIGAGLASAVHRELEPMDRLAREQYLDFLYFCRYRESLLCHANALSRFVIQPPRVLGMHAAAALSLRRSAVDPAVGSDPDAGARALKELLLDRWPCSVPVPDLVKWRREATSATPSAGGLRPIESLLVELFVAGYVDLRTVPVAAVKLAGERPEAFAAARWIAREHTVVPNLYHDVVRLQDAAGRHLLGLLDGTRTRADLLAAMVGPAPSPARAAQLEQALAQFAKMALLVR
jgi:SAM-dependent methyltransferase